MEEDEIIYVPLDDGRLKEASKNFLIDMEEAGDVYYVFNDFDEEGHISTIQDLSTRNPNYGAHMAPTTWFKNGVPKDEKGREIFPTFDSHVAPVSVLLDNRPLYEKHESRESDWWIRAEEGGKTDEYFIRQHEIDPLLQGFPEKTTEFRDEYYIPSLPKQGGGSDSN